MARLRQAMLLREIEDRPLLGSLESVTSYLTAALADEPVEHVQVLYLDAKNRLLRDERVCSGTTLGVTLHPRMILTRALELSATALIVSHNHPSGDPTPSAPDIAATRRLLAAAEALEIVVHDHLIVSAAGCTSMRAVGLL
jgi:DNA repair protein RadC